MSETDRAFIKAFSDRSARSATAPDRSPAGQRADDQRPIVSQFFTSATVGAGGEERGDNQRSPTSVAVATSPRPDGAKGRVRHFTLDTEERKTRTAPRLRRDEANQPATAGGSGGVHGVAAPHFSIENLKSRTATGFEPPHPPGPTYRLDGAAPSDPAAAPDARPFRPQWEVDGFDFPAICQELHQKSAEGLAELLRAVLTRAWRGKNVVAFTSFGHSEGTTTVALCIARLAASFSARVALLDGNIEHPTLAEALDLEVSASWSDMSRDVPLVEAAIGSADDRMVVLPLVAENEEEWKNAARQRAGSVIASLADSFDLVLIDAGPIYQAAHVWFSANHGPVIHTATVVRDLRRTANSQLEDVCLRLQQAGIQDVAIVDNFRAPAHAPGSPTRCMSDIGI